MRVYVYARKGRQSQKSVTIPKSRLQGYNPKVNAKPVDEGQGHHDDRTGRCHPSVSLPCVSAAVCGHVGLDGPVCACVGGRGKGDP